MTTVLTAGWPDMLLRQQKAAWRQRRGLFADAVTDALRGQPNGPRRIGAYTADTAIGRALASDLGHDVTPCGPDEDGTWPANADRFHVAVAELPATLPKERLDLVTKALRSVRAGGSIIVMATTVVAPQGDRSLVWSTAELAGVLDHASGAALHLESFRSFRHPGEPFVRGVIMSMTSLARPGAE